MIQKTKMGHKREDRYLGVYTIDNLNTTTCQLRSNSGLLLKQRVNLGQVIPYRAPVVAEESSTVCSPSPAQNTDTSSMMQTQLFDNHWLRLCRTGALNHVYNPSEDDNVDVIFLCTYTTLI